VATTTLDELIEQTRQKANIQRSNFVTDTEIVGYLNEARKQLRELIITADDSYYQASLTFNASAAPDNVQALPAQFWKLRGLDAYAGDTLRQCEVYAREYRNRFDPGLGYYFGGDGNSIELLPPQTCPQFNPWRINYVPKPLPLAPLVPGTTRSVVHDGDDGTTGAGHIVLEQAAFSAGDLGATIVIADSGTSADGTYTIISVESASEVEVLPIPDFGLGFGMNTTASVTGADDATRTFAVAATGPGDSLQSGYFLLQNGDFGATDLGAFIEIDVDNDAVDGAYEIIQVVGSTTIRVSGAPAGNYLALTGTATITRQPPDTENELDLTEDNFSEYLSVRSAMVIARKKRQDTLVAALGAERAAIEDRIASLSRMRQSEPQQAPNLWGGRRRSRFADDWEV
jgi:hypothetical protein